MGNDHYCGEMTEHVEVWNQDDYAFCFVLLKLKLSSLYLTVKKINDHFRKVFLQWSLVISEVSNRSLL